MTEKLEPVKNKVLEVYALRILPVMLMIQRRLIFVLNRETTYNIYATSNFMYNILYFLNTNVLCIGKQH